MPRNILTSPTGQKHHRPLEVLRPTPSARRNPRRDTSRAILILHQRRVHIRRDIARRNGIDIDVLRRPLIRQRLGELCDRALGRGVGGHGQAALEGEERGEIDDGAAAAGCPGGWG